MIVIKLGGSMIHSAGKLVNEILVYSKSTGETILIVPGGSIFATRAESDIVTGSRTLDGNSAMEQYGYYLADGTGAPLIDKTAFLKRVYTSPAL